MEKIRPNINPQSWEAFPAGELQRQYDREDRVNIFENIEHLIKPTDTILDIAIGGGREIRVIREHRLTNIIDACDYFQDVIDFIKEKDLKIRKLFILDANTKFKIDKYDIILATELIEHLENPLGFIRHCLKFVNKYLIITCPYQDVGHHKQHAWSIDDPKDLEIEGGKVKIINIGGTPHLLGIYEPIY
jgi:2-polyprenyl-3-methyl-5-hydroxy-6-metoxy-1,4-benzoquinol methylase